MAIKRGMSPGKLPDFEAPAQATDDLPKLAKRRHVVDFKIVDGKLMAGTHPYHGTVFVPPIPNEDSLSLSPSPSQSPSPSCSPSPSIGVDCANCGHEIELHDESGRCKKISSTGKRCSCKQLDPL